MMAGAICDFGLIRLIDSMIPAFRPFGPSCVGKSSWTPVRVSALFGAKP